MSFLFDSGVFSVEGLSGEILPGTKLYWYVSGTSTPLATYSDDALTVPNTNPVVVGADGRIPPIWLQEEAYKLRVELPDGTFLPTRDPIRSPILAILGPGGAGLVGFDWNTPYPDNTLGAALTLFDQPSTGAFWTTWDTTDFPAPSVLGAKVQRLNDRLFVGAATVTSGNFPATTKDYYETFEAAHTSAYGFRTSWAQLASGTTNGGIGVLGFARTLDSHLDGLQLSVGGWFATINDNTTYQQLATGLYGVAFRLPGAGMGIPGTGTVGGEVDVCNLGNSVAITPGVLYPSTGFTTAWQVNSGAFVTGSTTASAGITIGNNKADFFSGIVFGATAIAGLVFDGNLQPIDGAASAIRAACFQQIEWWTYPWTAPSFTISSRQLSPANVQAITAMDTGIFVGGPALAGLAFQTVYPGGATGSWLTFTPASGASPPTIGVDGGGADANILLRPRGAGMVSFGTYVGTPSAVIGYITIAESNGTPRKVAVIS